MLIQKVVLYSINPKFLSLRLYFANIVRTCTSVLNSKIAWFYASVKMNPIKLEFEDRKDFGSVKTLNITRLSGKVLKTSFLDGL